MSKRYEREIEEILRRSRASGSQRGAPARRAGPGTPEFLRPLNRVFVTPAERLIGFALLLGIVSYFVRALPPSPLTALLPAWIALVAVALFLLGLFGRQLHLVGTGQQTYWRNRPVEINRGMSLGRRIGYTWWRIRLAFGRMLGRR